MRELSRKIPLPNTDIQHGNEPAPAYPLRQTLVQNREFLHPTATAPIVAATPDATEQEQHQEDHQD